MSFHKIGNHVGASVMNLLYRAAVRLLFRAGSVFVILNAFPTSASAADWQLNGSATLDGSSVTLTQGAGNEAGSAFIATPVTLGSRSPWSIRFSFRIDPSTTDIEQIMGDGLTVVLADSPTLLGNGGSDLGVFGAPNGTSHYAFGIDTFNFGPSSSDPGEPPTPSIFHSFGASRDFGSFYNNAPIQYSDTPVGDRIRGRMITGWVFYNPVLGVDIGGGNVGDIGYLGFLVHDESDNALFAPVVGKAIVIDPGTHPVLDLPLYVGFTAGNGLASDRHTILSVEVITVPEPEACLLFGLAGLAIAFSRNMSRTKRVEVDSR